MLRLKKNKGFTLVELLAIIIVLSVVVGIVGYVIVNSINKVKEKSYLITITNIEKVSGTYVTENSNNLTYISDDSDNNAEYLCITVKNLIDMGFFKNDIVNSEVAKNKKVSKEDYIYVERDKRDRAIVETKYLLDDSEYAGYCNTDKLLRGNIDFSVTPSLSDWSLEKKITINYEVKNIVSANKVEYTYSYDNSNISLISDDGKSKDVKVSQNGRLTASIKVDGTEITKDLEISKIDNLAPSLAIDKESDDNPLLERTIKVTLSDNDSGIKSGSYFEYAFSKDDKNAPSNYEKVNFNNKDGDKKAEYSIKKSGLDGDYYLWIKANTSDVTGNELNVDENYGYYSFINKFNVTINKDSGIKSVTGAGDYVVGSEVTIQAVVNDYYKFNNWTLWDNIKNSNLKYTFIMPDKDITISASTKKYTCSEGTLTKDSSKGYICVDNSEISRSTKESCKTCHSTYVCGKEKVNECPVLTDNSADCWRWRDINCDYWHDCNCKTCYSCKSGWTNYLGSDDETRSCYKNASLS